MPVQMNSRANQEQVEAKLKEFLVMCGCTVSEKRYLPRELHHPKAGRIEAILVENAPKSVAPNGVFGVRVKTQSGRGSAGALVASHALAVRGWWRIPGIVIADGNAGRDLDRWVDLARTDVDGLKLLYVGGLAEFMNWFSGHLRTNEHLVPGLPVIPRRDKVRA